MLAMMPAAAAQDAAPVEEAAPAATISDAEIQAYADVAVALNKIQADASLSEADKSARMSAAVQKSGMDPSRFNAITEAASKDPQLKQKLQEAVRQ
jgi:hypothetical protein